MKAVTFLSGRKWRAQSGRWQTRCHPGVWSTTWLLCLLLRGREASGKLLQIARQWAQPHDISRLTLHQLPNVANELLGPCFLVQRGGGSQLLQLAFDLIHHR